ncbi:hypothetical protein F5146DRAFT_877161, partial [Armillaria mellea]
VSASRGVFKMNCSPVWTEVHNGGGRGIELREVFEGYIEMSVKYDAQDHSSGQGYEFRYGLWGIRSQRQD